MYSHRGIGEDMVGGALVRRMIPGKPEWPGGYMLSREEFLSIPIENRWVLVEQEHFEIIIRDPAAQRYIVPREDGRFDVVSGRVLNTEPLEREAADQLASDGRSIELPQRVPTAAARSVSLPSSGNAAAPGRRGRKPMSDEQRDAKRAQQNAERRLRRRARGADQHAEHT